MANTDYRRDYFFPDYHLTAFTQQICGCVTDDIAFFEQFNVNSADIVNLQALCDAFEVFPDDGFCNLKYLAATETKDNLIAELKLIVRNMALRVELKWGKQSAKYQDLGIALMSQLTDESFITRVKMIYSFMDDNKSELASEGLTQLMLDNMAEKIQALEDAKRYQKDMAIYRVERTKERIIKGNEIYNLVSKYCEIGKRIWHGVNPAKYNSYLIYKGNRKTGRKKDVPVPSVVTTDD